MLTRLRSFGRKRSSGGEAELYEKYPELDATGQHAAHCRAIAQNYKKATGEADALAAEHRAMRPHGMVQ